MKMVSFLRVIGLVLMVLLLSSCASQGHKAHPRGESLIISEEAETMDLPSREVVFVYGGAKDLPKRLVLSLSGEPFLLPSGYVRLVGVVSGPCLPAGRGKPTALIEIGGRGLALGEGESVNDYRVVGIKCDHVVLERGDNNDRE